MEILKTLKLRIKFYKVSNKSINELFTAFVNLKKEVEPEYKIRITDHEVIYTVGMVDREKHSPQVKLSFEEMEDGNTAVHGKIGPDSFLWFLYAALRAIIVVTFIIFCAVILSKWYTNMPYLFEIYIVTALFFSYFGLYFFAFYNRKKGTDQLDAILAKIDSII